MQLNITANYANINSYLLIVELGAQTWPQNMLAKTGPLWQDGEMSLSVQELLYVFSLENKKPFKT